MLTYGLPYLIVIQQALVDVARLKLQILKNVLTK
jgi:hypothetical protein